MNQPQDKRFLFVLSSARHNGNTAMLANEAAKSLPEATVREWIDLNETDLPKFTDRRHSTGEFPLPGGAELRVAEATLKATDIVICSPLYWYAMSANAKAYFDHWSGWLRVEEFDFRKNMANKNLWAVTTTSDEDERMVRPMIETYKLIAEYMQMNWRGMLIGHGSRPGDVMNEPTILRRAAAFFES